MIYRTNLHRVDRYKLHQRPLLKHAMNWKKTFEEEELAYSTARILSGVSWMERTRQGFGLVYRKSCDMNLNVSSVLGGIWKEVEGASGKLRECLSYTNYELKLERPESLEIYATSRTSMIHEKKHRQRLVIRSELSYYLLGSGYTSVLNKLLLSGSLRKTGVSGLIIQYGNNWRLTRDSGITI